MTCYDCMRKRPVFSSLSVWSEAAFAWMLVVLLAHVTAMGRWEFVLTLFFYLQMATAVIDTLFAAIVTVVMVFGPTAQAVHTEG